MFFLSLSVHCYSWLHMKHLLFLAFCVVLIPTVHAAADSYAATQKSAQQLTPLIQQDLDDMNREDQDAAEAQGDDLFPVSEQAASSKPSIQNNNAFLSVLIGTTMVNFTDVPKTSWFAPYVRDAAEKGIISGYKDASGKFLGLYGPDRNVSVEEVAKMAVKAGLIIESTCGNTVRNPMAATSWSRTYITCAEQANWSMYNDDGLDIRRPATRGEVVATLLDAFKVPYNNRIVAGSVFKDVKDNVRFAPAIEKAIADGIVSGYTNPDGSRTGSFGPNNSINRAEMAKIVAMAAQTYGVR